LKNAELIVQNIVLEQAARDSKLYWVGGGWVGSALDEKKPAG